MTAERPTTATTESPASNGDHPTVVSTTPSGTEILFALGVEPAAVSHACDFPPRAEDLPAIDSSRVDGETSAERDAQASAGDVYDVDVSLLRSVTPDMIVTQSVCGVCAVDEALVAEHTADLAVDPEIVSLSASDLGGVTESIRTVGRAVDRLDRAATVVDQFEGAIEQVADLTARADDRPSVVVLEWLDPLHVAANWVPELVTAAGGDPAITSAGGRSQQVDWERLQAVDPDVLVVAPCGVGPEHALGLADELQRRPGWESLSAVQADRVFALDGRILNRWTPRLAGELERLAGVLHPSLVGGDPDVPTLS